jgi:GNAT superfamily N-acetyltransferase
LINFPSQRGAIRQCVSQDINTIFKVINEAAKAYESVLPPEAYHETQMPMEELRREFKRVKFLAYEENYQILGVMGYEFIEDVALIRHAYVRPEFQRRGIGSLLLNRIEDLIAKSRRSKTIIIGTYTGASWAISFYERHGYRKSVNPHEILTRYYDIPRVQRLNSLTLEKKLP